MKSSGTAKRILINMFSKLPIPVLIAARSARIDQYSSPKIRIQLIV